MRMFVPQVRRHVCCPGHVFVLTSAVTVLPEGKAIAGQELSGEYFERAAPVVEIQVARAGYRLAR